MAIQTLFGTTPQEPNLLERLKAGVQKTRSGLVDRLEDVLAGKKEIDADLLDELEYALITADVGVRTVEDILERIRQRVDRKMAGDAAEMRNLIREHLLEVLRASETPVHTVARPPAVVMVVGVNGAGKTTTIGKLANRFLGEGSAGFALCGRHVSRRGHRTIGSLGAARGVEMIRQKTGADPSAVSSTPCTRRKLGSGLRNHRHRGATAHERESDGRARKNAAHDGTSDPGSTA